MTEDNKHKASYSIAIEHNMSPDDLKKCNKHIETDAKGVMILHVNDKLYVNPKVKDVNVVVGDKRPKEDSCPPWVKIAIAEIGEETVENKDPTTIPVRIAEYYKASDYHPSEWQLDDDNDKDAWCGGFLAWVMIKAGYTPPNNSIGAKYWLNFGEDDDDFHCGTIIIKGRDGGNHVSMAVGQDKSGKWIYALGGNQNNSVCVKIYPREVWYSMRFPKGYKGKKSPLPIINTTPQKFQEEIQKQIREK